MKWAVARADEPLALQAKLPQHRCEVAIM